MFNGDRSSKYPNAQDMVANGVPFINAGDLVDGHVNLETANKITREKYGDLGGAKLQLGDIVYCLRGTLGKNAYIDNFTEGTVASSLVAIRPKNVDGRYLFHVLNSDIEYRQRIVRDEGAAQPNLSAKSVSEFILPIPDIEEQKKISAFLDGLSNLITLHQKKCLEWKKRDFTRASISWEQRKLGECLSEITYGFTNPMSDTDDGPWKITAKDIVNGKIDFNAARHTSQGEYDCLTEKSKPRLGDLLLTKDGTLGRIAIVDSVNVCINQSVALLRFNEEYSAQYAKTLLETPMYQRQMLDDAGGGTIKHIYITKVDKMSIPAPSIIEQEKLVYFFRQLDHVITLHQRKLELLKRLRNSLIDRCFIGEKYTMSKEILYHGSPNRVIVSKFGFGEDRHDNGRGFYLTENLELAKEQAVCRPESKCVVF